MECPSVCCGLRVKLFLKVYHLDVPQPVAAAWLRVHTVLRQFPFCVPSTYTHGPSHTVGIITGCLFLLCIGIVRHSHSLLYTWFFFPLIAVSLICYAVGYFLKEIILLSLLFLLVLVLNHNKDNNSILDIAIFMVYPHWMFWSLPGQKVTYTLKATITNHWVWVAVPSFPWLTKFIPSDSGTLKAFSSVFRLVKSKKMYSFPFVPDTN